MAASSEHGKKRTAEWVSQTFSLSGPAHQRQRLEGDKTEEHNNQDTPPPEEHPKDDFFWIISYQERACLTKLKTKRLKSTRARVFYEIDAPREVKFLTRHPDHQTQLPPPVCTTFRTGFKLFDLELSNFEYQVKKACGDAFNFELTVDGKDWNSIFSIIKENDYTHSQNGWRSSHPRILRSECKDTPAHLHCVAQSLDRALFVNMANDGEAKKFIDHLLQSIQIHANVHDIDVYHESPVNNSYTNGKVQFVDANDDLTWYDDYLNPVESGRCRSKPASKLSDSADPVCDSVPDHIWYLHKYPGYFVLNVECTSFHSYSARVECMQQMLTQMHFQNSAFGLLLSTNAWSLIFMSKSDGVLLMNQISVPFADCNEKFIVENLKMLCSWLYRILDYRMKCHAG